MPIIIINPIKLRPFFWPSTHRIFLTQKGFDSFLSIRYTNAILADYEISIGPLATLNAYFLLTDSFSDKLGVLWKISRSVNHEVMD